MAGTGLISEQERDQIKRLFPMRNENRGGSRLFDRRWRREV